MIRVFYSFFFITFLNAVIAQESSILGRFSITETEGSVFLFWTINQGSTCNGIRVFRSSDALNYEKIGEIVGVCGSSSEAISYSFTDKNPIKNSVNYYKLELGFSGESEVLSIEIIDIEDNGFQIRPNPIKNNGRIYFDNDRKEKYHLILYQINGKIAYETSSSNDYFDFDVSGLFPAVYFFTISEIASSLVKTKGTILVVK